MARSAIWLAVAIAVFVTLATSLARTKAPWCDEGWFANPAYNLAFHGRMATNVLEPSGHYLNAYLSGIQERTYIVVPNHIVALAGWFRLFGFSLLTMRAYSIAWGAAGLCFLFYILTQLFPDRRVAQLGTLLTAIDFVYLWSSADGRMDSSANALALASLAAYLYFRERSFAKAICFSQILGAAAVFTHPNAVVVLLVVPVLIWRWDRTKLQFRHAWLAAAPYVFFGVLWSLYIAQRPADFAAQFFANAAGRNWSRWKQIVQPWLAIWGEVVRHLASYVISGLWSAKMGAQMMFVPLFYLAALTSFLRKRRGYPFTACIVTVLLGMTFLNGFKAPMYLIYLIPFYCAICAFELLHLWSRNIPAQAVAVALGILFVYLQCGIAASHIRADEYHRDYQPAIVKLQQEHAAGKTILGTAALGFGLGFRGFADDWRLGEYSRLDPDVLVVDRSYREFLKKFQRDEPRVLSRFVSTLTGRYRPSSSIGSFWIFERIKGEPCSLKKPARSAEDLLERLSAANRDLAP